MNSTPDGTVSSLREMQAQMTQWQDEKPQGNWGDELRLQDNDLVIFQFASDGSDGRKFLNLYRSHAIDRIAKNGRPYAEFRYCPVQSGEAGLECPLCIQGVAATKQRLSLWLYVQNILHTTLPQGKTFPQTQYEEQVYFNEEVNDFKLWHTSGWKESPFSDIRQNGTNYKGLHNFTAHLLVVGTGLDKRYKIYAIPNSPFLPPELYAKANAECESIMDILHKQISSAVQPQPTQAPLMTGQPSSPVSVQNITPFTPVGTPVPSLEVPTLDISPPVEPPPVEEKEEVEEETESTPPAPPEEPAPPNTPASTTEAPDDKRPLKSLF